jgi:diacylglycerol kinase family enzyme
VAVAADILLRRAAHGGTHRLRFSALQVTLDPEQPWELDGEVMGSTRRLTVMAEPGALLLRVPRGSG